MLVLWFSRYILTYLLKPFLCMLKSNSKSKSILLQCDHFVLQNISHLYLLKRSQPATLTLCLFALDEMKTAFFGKELERLALKLDCIHPHAKLYGVPSMQSFMNWLYGETNHYNNMDIIITWMHATRSMRRKGWRGRWSSALFRQSCQSFSSDLYPLSPIPYSIFFIFFQPLFSACPSSLTILCFLLLKHWLTICMSPRTPT